MDELTTRFPELIACKNDIKKALDLMITTYKNGGKILVCGNGGSASDCEHIVGELMKSFLKPRVVNDDRIPKHLRQNLQGSLPAISLPSQFGILSAFINDVDPEMAYSQLVYGYAKGNDLVMGISTSGNSVNIVNAVETASAMGVKTVSLTGKSDSRLSEISDVTIKVPESETYKVQELHLPVYHYLCSEIESAMF